MVSVVSGSAPMAALQVLEVSQAAVHQASTNGGAEDTVAISAEGRQASSDQNSDPDST
jgi:hypothetical protein